MITHIVLLQPKPEKTEEEIASVLSHVSDLQEHIPDILETQVGNTWNTMSSAKKNVIILKG
jgi:Stress responsive A/B Barrel Domain